MCKYIISLLFVLVLFTTFSSGQFSGCVPYDSPANNFTRDFCPHFFSNPDSIWLLYDFPGVQNAIDTALNKTLWYLPDMVIVFPKKCFNSLLSLLCNSIYPICSMTMVPELGYEVPMPSFPCYSACEMVQSECSSLLGLVGTPLNCSEESELGYRLFPDQYYESTFNNVPVRSFCYPYSQLFQNDVDWNLTTCPAPLVKREHIGDKDSYCSITCPDPSRPIEEWETFGKTEFAFGLISVILMFFLCLHYIIDPRFRNAAKRFQLYTFFCQMMFSASFIVGGSNPAHTTWCADSTRIATSDNPNCAAQSILFVMFGLASSFWWAICSGHLFFKMNSQKKKISKLLEAAYLTIAFGIPMIFTITANRMGAMGYFYQTPFCFIFDEVPHTISYQYVFFYIPLSVPTFIAIVFNAMVIFKLIKHIRSMKKTFKQPNNSQASLFSVNLRLIVWCGVLILFFCILFIFRIAINSTVSTIFDDLIQWGACRVSAELWGQSKTKCENDKFDNPVSYGGSILYIILICSTGSFSFLVFGTSSAIHQFWKILFNLARQNKWDDVKKLIKDKKFVRTYFTKPNSADSSIRQTTPTGSEKDKTNSNNTSPGISITLDDISPSPSTYSDNTTSS